MKIGSCRSTAATSPGVYIISNDAPPPSSTRRRRWFSGRTAVPGQRAPTPKVRFASDSLLEGAGFEPSVPIAKGDASQVRSGLAGGLVAFGPDG
jgi:hypothetical protein